MLRIIIPEATFCELYHVYFSEPNATYLYPNSSYQSLSFYCIFYWNLVLSIIRSFFVQISIIGYYFKQH